MLKKRRDLLDRVAENEVVLLLLLLVVFFLGNKPVYLIMYFAACAYMIFRTLYAGFRKREKTLLCAAYLVLLNVQLVFAQTLIFDPGQPVALHWVLRGVGVASLALCLYVERFVTANKNARFYLPSLEDVQAISFSDMRENGERFVQILDDLERTAEKLTPDTLTKALTGTSGHSSIEYVNHGSLTDAYFQAAEAALDDPWLYIVVSDTGSAASEIIGSVTRREYNHASLSFDRKLDTILSYNGGENLYPPGMNPEMVAHFHKKPDASVLVYRVAADRARKERVLEVIRRINQEGSAYNMMGLVTKQSYKPNIMFCSQFVYRMLQEAGVAYFDKPPGQVRPTDFIELDYRRKLEFVEEIRFR